jgi:hypothetical protein
MQLYIFQLRFKTSVWNSYQEELEMDTDAYIFKYWQGLKNALFS